jgi:RimJ/RimL family protein N-acetyltransferase
VNPLPAEPLTGSAVVLRPWRVGDAARLRRAVVESAEHLRPWMPWVADEPLSVAERRAMIEQWQRDWAAGGDLLLGVFCSGEVAGGCGLHRRGGPDTLEVGYWIHAAFLRRGLATEAAALLTDRAFTVAGIDWVEIHHDKLNVASAAVPRRLGYEFVGEQPDEPTSPGDSGIDCAWRIARLDWLARGRGAN